ncbi:MAG: hypothetical protein KJ804_14380 [Proteobacteria bacterium]|nr:hypothetical protein [Pseudomonadota bacterium]MBU1059496.1 hypothetical protein [Pseudomonadota bacterium]
MLQAGVAQPPSAYGFSGYNEIQIPPPRYSIIDRTALTELCLIKEEERFRNEHRAWAKTEWKKRILPKRIPHWSETVAAGAESSIKDIQKRIAGKCVGCSVRTSNRAMVLKEPHSPYNTVSGTKNGAVSLENPYFSGINH